MHLHYHGQFLSEGERENVTSITIDANAIHHRIPIDAFVYYKRLKCIDIPDRITDIGHWAFMECASLTDIRLPQGLTSIGNSVFIGCRSLTRLHIPDGISKIGKHAFHYCEELRHVNIPRGIIELQEGTFGSCESLTHIDIPDGVITIGEYVFMKCTSLTRVNLPNGLQRLMNGAFCNCTSLEQIHIPEGLEVIENNTFNGCRSLVYVYIPPSVRHIHWRGAFIECKTLFDQYRSVYPNESTNGYDSDGEKYWDKFHNWLRTRYDDYPFLKTCWKKHVTMVDIAQCVEEHGMDCLLEVEKGTGWNGFDILFLNHFIGNDVHVLDLIANIILMLLCPKGSN